MSTIETPLKLAVNPHLIDKNESGNVSLYASGWQNVEFTPEELAASIKRGWAYCPQLLGDRRTENFLASDIASVDVDHGTTIEAALSNPVVKNHALMLYTTPRHTAEAHRFRVVFRLPKTIVKSNQMVTITRSLTRILGGDRAAVDATRICFGNRRALIHRIDRTISLELLGELLADGAVPDDQGLGADAICSRRSLIELAADQELRVADGRRMRLLDLPPKTSVHCPVHQDERPSAFVLEGRNGGRGVHCSTCAKTFWTKLRSLDGDSGVDFVEAAREVAARAKPIPEHEADENPLVREFYSGCRVHFVVGDPAPTMLLPGVTFARSPKGSGKTESIKRLVATAKKPLLIGHRRTLIRGSCIRLGLSCYLDRDKAMRGMGAASEPKFSRDRYGICLDSLLQIRPDHGYDLIILDESEQVLAHLLSDTMAERGDASRIFTLLGELVRRATSVIALDADLGFVTFNTLSRMVGDNGQRAVSQRRVPLHLWINEVEPPGQKKLYLYDSRQHLIADMMAAIDAKRRCFVASNCKGLIDKFAASIRHRFGADRRVIVITSETGSNAEVKDFVANAKERAATYDVILCSPSLGTGVDITFPENAELVDVVFGFCEPSITTHRDFDQQIARVRHPGEVRVYVSPRRFRYETHIDVVRDDMLRAGLYRDLLEGYEDDGSPRFSCDDPLIEMAALVKSEERASMNDLRSNFVRYKQDQGCAIEYVGKDLDRSVEGYGVLAIGGRLREDELIAKITAAPVLPRPEFESVGKKLEGGGVVEDTQRIAYDRTRLEMFYRRPATPELVRLDDRAQQRLRVRLFQSVTQLAPDRVQFDGSAPLHPDLRFLSPDHSVRASTIVRLLRLTPIWRAEDEAGLEPSLQGRRGQLIAMPDDRSIAERVASCFDAQVVFDRRDLHAFARYMLDNKGAVENTLAVEVRRDVPKKPVQQLGSILRMIGLRLAAAGSRKVQGRKIHRYRLCPVALQGMQDLAGGREQQKAWPFMVGLYGPHMDPSDEDDWAGLDRIDESLEKVARFARGTTGDFFKDQSSSALCYPRVVPAAGGRFR